MVKGMERYSKAEILELLARNSIAQPKAKYSNAVIAQMLGAVGDDFVACVEPTRGAFALNRGSVVECIIKAVVYGVADTFKTSQGRKDLDLAKVDNRAFGIDPRAKKMEVKFATSFAPASESAPDTAFVLLVTDRGVYNVRASEHQGRYTRNSDLDGELNAVLSELFGFDC